MTPLFAEKEHSKAVNDIKNTQEAALMNIKTAIAAMNQTCDLSNQTLNEFSQYASQVEKIRDSIQNIYFRISKLKSRVEIYKQTQILGDANNEINENNENNESNENNGNNENNENDDNSSMVDID